MSEIVQRVVLSDVIADRLQEHIISNQLSPGTSLPTEYELMKQFGVGRSAVREAAKVLVQRGLVDVRPGRGMTVAEPLGDVVTRQLIAHLQLSKASASQLFEVRELLETQIARSAAEHHTDADLDQLRHVVRQADDAPDDDAAYARVDLAFHQALARATQNPFYSLVVSAIFLLLRDPSLAPLRYKSVRKLTQREHRSIISALETGNADEAAAACRAHLNRVRAGMERLFSELRREPQPSQPNRRREGGRRPRQAATR